MAKAINNMDDLAIALQPVMKKMVDNMANRVYETLNFFLQRYYDSYDPIYYRRQYDFLRSGFKVDARIIRGKAVASVYIDVDYMSNYYGVTGQQVATWANDKQVKLHYWNTEEEAFQEYKLFKESEIRVLALRYRDKIPDRLFDALIKCEVRPYSPYES